MGGYPFLPRCDGLDAHAGVSRGGEAGRGRGWVGLQAYARVDGSGVAAGGVPVVLLAREGPNRERAGHACEEQCEAEAD